jgi:hypothetical protein
VGMKPIEEKPVFNSYDLLLYKIRRWRCGVLTPSDEIYSLDETVDKTCSRHH